MNLRQYIEVLRSDPSFMRNVACWKEVPARPARYEPFPDSLDPRVIQAMDKRGVHKLYSHQYQAVTAALQGEDIVVVGL